MDLIRFCWTDKNRKIFLVFTSKPVYSEKVCGFKIMENGNNNASYALLFLFNRNCRTKCKSLGLLYNNMFRLV